MYEYFLGIVKDCYKNKIIFECNNLGYVMEGANLEMLPLNTKVKLYIYFYQKPTNQQFFGFDTKPKKTFFIHLLNVSSVGPKTALKLLNSLSLDSIKLAISNQDCKILQQCKGITPKIANNIINYFSNQTKIIGSLENNQNDKSDLVFATLLKLGFSPAVINNFLLKNVN